MKARSLRTTAIAAAALAATAALPAAASAEPAVGITSAAPQQVVNFDTTSPGTATTTPILGLVGKERLRGIDRRPANGVVYGFGSEGRVYTLDPASGVAAAVSTPGPLGLGDYGVDFNPVVDRLRVVTDADRNGRIDVTLGTLTNDLALSYAAGDVNAGRNPKVNASAYSNNFAGAGATVLYGIDTARDVLVTQAPPNDGKLNTIGALGINANVYNGFDISPTTGVPFAALREPLVDALPHRPGHRRGHRARRHRQRPDPARAHHRHGAAGCLTADPTRSCRGRSRSSNSAGSNRATRRWYSRIDHGQLVVMRPLVAVPGVALGPGRPGEGPLHLAVHRRLDLRADVDGGGVARAHVLERLADVGRLLLEVPDDRAAGGVRVRAVHDEQRREAGDGHAEVGVRPVRPGLVLQRAAAGARRSPSGT